MKELFTIFIILISVHYIFAQDDNSKDFSFDGLKLGTSLSNFENKYPNALKENSDDEKFGVVEYKVINLETASYAHFSFFKNKLYFIAIVYYKNFIENIGGISTILDHLADKLGTATKYKKLDSNSDDAKEILWWDFANKGISIEFVTYTDGYAAIHATDEFTKDKLNEIKAKSAKIGF